MNKQIQKGMTRRQQKHDMLLQFTENMQTKPMQASSKKALKLFSAIPAITSIYFWSQTIGIYK